MDTILGFQILQGKVTAWAAKSAFVYGSRASSRTPSNRFTFSTGLVYFTAYSSKPRLLDLHCEGHKAYACSAWHAMDLVVKSMEPTSVETTGELAFAWLQEDTLNATSKSNIQTLPDINMQKPSSCHRSELPNVLTCPWDTYGLGSLQVPSPGLVKTPANTTEPANAVVDGAPSQSLGELSCRSRITCWYCLWQRIAGPKRLLCALSRRQPSPPSEGRPLLGT